MGAAMNGQPAVKRAGQPARSARINVRLSEESLATIRAAAALQGQDLTSFVLGAALDRARTVIITDNVLHLSESDARKLGTALADESSINEALGKWIVALPQTPR